MADRYIYLIRHGQYHPNTHEDESLHGHLNDLGKVQAEAVAKRLKLFPISEIYASTMIRATETAEIIINSSFPDKKIEPSDLIRECTPCIPKEHQHLFADTSPDKIKKGRDRADKAFASFFKPTKRDKHEAIVCHGNLIRYLVCKSIEIDAEKWLKMDICNCSMTVVKVSGKKSMKLITFNDTGHLTPDQLTFN